MNDIIVTDHALIRWLERAHDLDVEQLKAKMAEMARPFIDARVAEAEIGGLWFVFDGKKIITVKPQRTAPQQRFKHDRKFQNGTDRHGEKPHWKMVKRRRDHR